MNDYIPKHNKTQNGIPMYSESGKQAGFVVGDEWRKNIITAWMLQKPPALAVDIVTLDAAINAGAAWLVITNTETHIVYRASIETVQKKGWRFNRGYFWQQGLTLPYWQKWNDGEDAPPPLPPTAPPPDVYPLKYTSRAVKGAIFNGQQLNLFEVKK
jgi:hypothetical protein